MDRKNKILIIDDEKANVITLAQFLKSDCDIIVASDGTSGLEAAKKQQPDLILLDIIMPDISGFEVLSKLKDSAITINTPVIFITGLSDASIEEKGLLLGAVDYITKPFNIAVVKARIGTHLKMAEYIRTIERLCMLDALTGLPNRRGFDNRISVEWGRAFREKANLGLIILDIDKFKVYNDTYGHPQGDLLLKGIAGVLNSTMNRASDYVSRWGGEEFTVLLPDTNKNGTKKLAEKIRENFKKTIVLCPDGTETSATVSLGALSITPGEDDTIEDFISNADKLLYLAKNNGRDQVCMPPD